MHPGLYIFLFFSVVACNTWYISPLGNNDNTGQSANSPFLDLETALTHSSTGDTVVASSGMYSGSSNIGLTLTAINLIGSDGSASTIFDGTHSSSVPFIFELSGTSNITGVTVASAENGIELLSSTTLIDIKIKNIEDDGIYIKTGAIIVTMTNITFSSCHSGVGAGSSTIEEVSMEYSSFSNCSAPIYIANAYKSLKNITVIGTDFNTGEFGSQRGLYIENTGSSSITIGVLVKDCTFKNYDFGAFGVGIYVHANRAEVTILGCTMENLSCSSGCGVYIDGYIDLVIGYTNFIKNRGGSAVALSSQTTKSTKVYNSIFKDNFVNNMLSGSGGAVELYSISTTALINETLFIGNSAVSNAGAINNLGPDLQIVNCNFSKNSAGSNGGAVYTKAPLVVMNSTFRGNIATGNGGAIYTSYTGFDSTIIEKSNFTENQATNGGAFYQGSSANPLEMKYLSFDSNTASANGGAISTVSQISLLGVNITSNSAQELGGGVYIDTGSYPATIQFTNFASNIASENGGGLYCDTGDLTIDFVRFISNDASNGSAYSCGTCSVSSYKVNVNANNGVDCSQ